MKVCQMSQIADGPSHWISVFSAGKGQTGKGVLILGEPRTIEKPGPHTGFTLIEETTVRTENGKRVKTKTTSKKPWRVEGAIQEQTNARVIPAPESAWSRATKANRKSENKLKDSQGNWSLWFLLSRALVLSRESLDEAVREMAPADSLLEAHFHLQSAGKARALGADARRHAILQAMIEGMDIPNEAAAAERAFIDWFGAVLADRLAAGDFGFVDTITGFVKESHRLPQGGFPADVKQFCRVVARMAEKCGGPPTKASVKKEIYKLDSNLSEKSFLSLMKRAGFEWLPHGKSGPQP